MGTIDVDDFTAFEILKRNNAENIILKYNALLFEPYADADVDVE